MRPALQVVAVGAVVVGLGAGIALSGRHSGALTGNAGGPSAPVNCDSQLRKDVLNGRLLWLASREPPRFDYLRVRGPLQ